MLEPNATEHETFGVLAEFPTAEALIDATKAAREAGYRQIDAYTPFPVEDVWKALEVKDNRVLWLTLAGGVLGAAGGYGLQVYTNLAYPIIVGSRPLVAPQAFMLITFEMMVLGAVLAGIFGMLVLNRLPRLNHPVFDAEHFGFGGKDRFFLIVFGNDPKFDEQSVRGFFDASGASGIQTIEHAEEPQ
ncbi:DUF3341 domain-containing protein [Tianweitania sediminis]|uniref:DUF3341 domain-containing protein n=1 Tax=Tianweitania sediminis TaxID=1502156 RepID=A0A8J7R287_9HYPH|nr:DUF3341 domain-containing protein [Tianweitania sediminis]MBP0439513.1 DUF3341 domain-containing protein [Tianweitania sediminis]